MKYTLCSNNWNHFEIQALQEVIESNQFTMGKKVRNFEKLFARHIGSKYAVMANSGSSANLLAISSLVYSGLLNKGRDEIIVPVVGWPTSYAPIHQNGLRLRFVDVEPDSYTIDSEKLKKAVTGRSGAIMAIHLLGSPCNMDVINEVAKEHGLLVIEDNCEGMGCKWEGQACGTIGDVGTFSTFYSHHLNTMEGGILVTDNYKIYETALMLRSHGWTRDLYQSTHQTPGWDDLFNFQVPGYNLRPLEFSAALGIEQMQKLSNIVIERQCNAAYFLEMMNDFPELCTQCPMDESSWFQFAILCDGKKYKRDEIIAKLSDKNIETRPIMTGNFLRHPASKYMRLSCYGEISVADWIHEEGFLVGNHPFSIEKQINHLAEVLKNV